VTKIVKMNRMEDTIQIEKGTNLGRKFPYIYRSGITKKA
jgi:hypothetical protein